MNLRKFKNHKRYNKKDWLYVGLLALLIILRFVLTVNIPNYHNLYQNFDDTLYLNSARNILQGNWLGDYSNITLIKYQSICLFYVLIHYLHIPFVVSIFALNLLAALTLMTAFRPTIENRWIRAIIFGIVLYMPINVSIENYSVARSSVTTPVVSIILACLVGIFLRSEYPVRKQIKWFFILGVFFAFYLWLREESITIVPLVFGCFAIYVLRLIIIEKKTITNVVGRARLWLVPLLITAAYLIFICILNYKYYGIFDLSDRTAGNFKGAVNYITSIDDGIETRDMSVCVTTRMRNIALENSTKLKSIEPDINRIWDRWSEMRGRDDGELMGDDYIWVLRGAAAENGYYEDAVKADAFWKDVKEELKQAYDGGLIKRAKGVKLAFSYFPLRMADVQYMMKYAWNCIKTLSLNNDSIQVKYVSSRTEEARMAEELLNARYIYDDEDNTRVWNEGNLEKIISFLNVLSTPYRKWGGCFFFVSLFVILPVWTIVLVIRKKEYKEWEKWMVALGTFLTLYFSSFAICCFTEPWYSGRMSGYHRHLLPMLVLFELMVFIYGIPCILRCFYNKCSDEDLDIMGNALKSSDVSVALCLITWNEIAGCRHDIPLLDMSKFSEVYCIDGGSTDGTVEYLESMGIKVYSQTAKGLNQACKDGVAHCHSDAFVFYHPKGSIPVEDTYKFKEYFEKGYQLVVGSRMMRGGHNEEDTRLFKPRKWFVLGLGLLAKLLFQREGNTVWDTLHGFRGMTVEAFNKCDISDMSPSVDIEIVCRSYKLKLKRVEFPTNEMPRIEGKSHFRAISTGKKLLRYMWFEIERGL